MGKNSSRILGRQDYVEPHPMSAADRARVGSVTVEQDPDRKTWFSVSREGVVLGYVTTRMEGQLWRGADMGPWLPVASEGNASDPQHGQAVLALLDHVDQPALADQLGALPPAFQFHPDNAIPSGDWTWVFGSTFNGLHQLSGNSGARIALASFGAVIGVGHGPAGQSYAIPTVDRELRRMPHTQIAFHVARFLRYAAERPEQNFFVTRVGCDRSRKTSFTDAYMAPLFAACPFNCSLPESWITHAAAFRRNRSVLAALSNPADPAPRSDRAISESRP